MASEAESTVALSLGSQRISMAVFDPAKGGGLILKAYSSTTILADPALEMVRLPQVTLAVKELAEGLKVQKSRVRYAMSGQSVFTRFMKLPPLDEDNIGELVAFEAQQHVPFPLDEVIWDWQLLDSSGIEKEVALVAIKSDALSEINGTVTEAGLTTRMVDAAPMALYNAFRYNYPDVEESVLLMDIGAKATDLVYIEGTRLFTRSIPVGAASVTTAIAKEYNIAFAEAENHKVTSGMVALGGGHTEQLDEATAQLASVITVALKRLPTEVARTNSIYRTKHEGNAPTRVFLAGGGANLPYIREFLEEKLRIPIELFNPLKRVSVGKGLDVEQLGMEAHMIGDLVGLGLRGVGAAQVSIELVPDALGKERASAQRRPFLVAAAVILIAGMLAWLAHKSSMASTAEAHRADAQKENADLSRYSGPIERLAKEQKALEAIGTSYGSVQQARIEWIDVLNMVSTYFNETDVWMTDFSPVGHYKLGDFNSAKDRIRANPGELNYGASGLEEFGTLAEGRKSRKKKKGPALPPPPADAINAIRITGFWKTDVKAVHAIIKKIQNDEESIFTLKKGANGPNLTDEELFEKLPISLSGETTLAEQFVVVLPLKTPISIK